MTIDLTGRVALVTGSTGGIGRGIAERLSAAGARVVLNSRSAPESPITLAGSTTASLHVAGDVSDEGDVRAMIEAIRTRYGVLDVVVNNAGTTKVVPHRDLDGIDRADWDRILAVNVIGAWNTVKAALPLLRASDVGCVVNVSSMAGIRVTGSSLPYSVSKAALNQLTRALAKALGPEIRVNAVAPGFIETPWTSDWGERRQEVIDLTALGRVGTPDDVADAVESLIRSAYVTGEILIVDGGLSLNN
jgi:ketoreductase RED2